MQLPRLYALIRAKCGLGLLLGGLTATSHAAPFINEFHAENIGPILNSIGVTSGTNDVNGSSTDWIELRNPDGASVSLNGWALSDDAATPGKWVFPNVSIAANGYLVIFASAKNRAVASVQLHTNFKLSNSGAILLSQPNGAGGWTLVHAINPYPSQKPRFSYGFPGTTGPGGTLGYMETQTPGTANNAAAVAEFVADTSFSLNRGFYDTAQSVTIASPTPGATLIYTTNGSQPTTSNGTQVPPPDPATPPSVTVNVTTTTLLRARAIRTGLGPTNVDTHTYIFPSAVLTQNAPPATSLNWGSSGPDWQMDPDVVNHADPANRCVADDLKAIPTISVVMNWNDLFGGTTAIYPPASGVANEGVEREVSIELINPDANKADPNAAEGFQANASIEIFGGTSQNRWNSDKLSMKAGFKSDVNYPIYGDDGTNSFDNIVLDARYNNVWHYGGGSSPLVQRARSDYYGDAFTGDVQRLMGSYGPRAKQVHVYLNGLYWGMFTMHERPDEHFTAAYLGGNEDDWDVIKHGKNNASPLVAGQIINPTLAASFTNHTAGVNYQALLDLVAADLSVQANYDAAVAKVDPADLAAYILVNFYFGNTDWSHQNWYASYRRTLPGAKWHYHAWDAEHIMENVTDNVTADGTESNVISAGGPGYVHERLALNPEYRLLFADVAHRHFFNNGVLTNPRIWQIYDSKLQLFSEALRAESARWGDNRAAARTAPNTNIPYLRGVDWMAQRTFWQNTYFPTRSSTANIGGSVLQQIKTRNLYPAVAAPSFSQHGGIVPANYSLSITNPGGAGSIYYTMDGSDPRVPITSGISVSAQQYVGPVTLAQSQTLNARIRNGTTWSALNGAYFSVGTVPAAAGNLVISKIHYRPALPSASEEAAGFTDRSDFEFLEVLNTGQNRIDLSGISFSEGLDVTFLAGGIRELGPGERGLFVAKKAAFELRYGTGLPIIGEFVLGTNLANDGETLTLLAANKGVIFTVTYQDTAGWPTAPDGTGPSLVLINPGVSDPGIASNWRQSTSFTGSPGTDDRLLLANWTTANFPAGGSVAEPLADPDGDGLVNLVEITVGSNPNAVSSLALLPQAEIQLLDIGAGPQPFLTYTIRHVKAAEQIVLTIQTSADLATWTSAASEVVPVGVPVDHGDGTESRTFRTAAPVSASTQRYFRTSIAVP